MRKPTVSIMIAVILLLVLGVAPAAATTPLDVVIDGALYFDTTPGSGPFISRGLAVDAGIFCSAGTVIALDAVSTGWQSFYSDRGGLNWHADNMFVCADGSGTITIQIQARLDWRTNWSATLATWVVKEGTGDYVNLHGGGDIYGVQVDEGVEDHYTGKLQ